MTKADSLATPAGDITITPINHASLVLGFGPLTVYLDPVGSPDRYRDLPRPDLIVLTHEHATISSRQRSRHWPYRRPGFSGRALPSRSSGAGWPSRPRSSPMATPWIS